MSAKASYAKIGMFVIGAVAIAVTAVVVLGAGQMFKKPIYMETYLDESVQGLEIGSQVMRRGVKIGRVDRIDFVSNVYRNAMTADDLERFGRYVVVILALEPEAVPYLAGPAIAQSIDHLAHTGLRVRLQTQLTGPSYLDVDHLDPARNRPLEIAWTPRHLYVPSAPSTITRYTESIDAVFRRIEATDVEAILNELGLALESVRRTLDDAKITKLSEQTAELMRELRTTNQNLNAVLLGPEAESLVSDLSDAAASAKNLLESAEAKLPKVIDDLSDATGSVSGTAASLNEMLNRGEITETLDNITSASTSLKLAAEVLPETAALMRRTLRNVDSLVDAQSQSLAALLENLRAITDDLREVAADAKRNPSRLLFGEPPPQSNPGRGR